MGTQGWQPAAAPRGRRSRLAYLFARVIPQGQLHNVGVLQLALGQGPHRDPPITGDTAEGEVLALVIGLPVDLWKGMGGWEVRGWGYISEKEATKTSQDPRKIPEYATSWPCAPGILSILNICSNPCHKMTAGTGC